MAYGYDASPQDAKRFYYVLAVLSSDSSTPSAGQFDSFSDLKANFTPEEGDFTNWTMLGALEDFSVETSADDEREDTAGNKIKLSEIVSLEGTDLSQNYEDLRILDREMVDYIIVDPTQRNDAGTAVPYTQLSEMITSVARSLADNTWTTKFMAERKHRDSDDFVSDSTLATS